MQILIIIDVVLTFLYSYLRRKKAINIFHIASIHFVFYNSFIKPIKFSPNSKAFKRPTYQNPLKKYFSFLKLQQ